MLQCIEPGNFQKFVIEKVLAAGQVLYMVGRMTLDAVKTGLSRVLAGYPYHGEADRWENNIGAALAYQTEISHCRLEIGNSAYAIPIDTNGVVFPPGLVPPRSSQPRYRPRTPRLIYLRHPILSIHLLLLPDISPTRPGTPTSLPLILPLQGMAYCTILTLTVAITTKRHSLPCTTTIATRNLNRSRRRRLIHRPSHNTLLIPPEIPS
ncbi:hypothetical protein IF1G_11339 [Cordyceps javanica]|uniref:Uncharacterized protein n=1 Tax=Cordyceps javanica TaxID=43265 RepID=A0A545UKK6_9HYPO|nr:hypothetical protein IF1G_11339 [Cordyceps javanica]